MGLGRIILMFGGVLVVVFVFFDIGYKVGHASGVVETTSKLETQILNEQTAATTNASAPYSTADQNPIEDVRTNPFSY